MAFDHSQTYKKITFRNLPHIARARSVKKIIKNIPLHNFPVYYDVGCSNGYLTHLVAKLIGAKITIGWDHSKDNLLIARSLYPEMNFHCIDLNKPYSIIDKADFITCFETIEHVGDISEAINNIDNMVKKSGQILYTVPIESGLIGAIKYLIKKYFFNYTLEEISTDEEVWKDYECTLFSGKDISVFRGKKAGWATHFGFDYRNFEQKIKQKYAIVKTWNSGTTRFLLIKKSAG